MEHEFPGKQDYRRFRFNQNVWFKFSATSSSEWNSIFQNFQKRGKPRELHYSRHRITIRGIFFPESFLSIQLCSWSFSVEWFAFRTFNISGNFSGKFLYHLTLFPNFRKFWLNGKDPRKHYVSFQRRGTASEISIWCSTAYYEYRACMLINLSWKQGHAFYSKVGATICPHFGNEKLHSPMADHGTLNALFCLNISPYMATSDSKPTGKAQSKNMNVILFIWQPLSP